jgi:hypothetical protein
MWPGRLSSPVMLAALELETKLGRNHHLIANRAERFPDDLFIRERPVRFGGIEERDAPFDSRADDRDAFLPARGRPIAEANAHAAKAERRDFQSAPTQCALLHCSVLLQRSWSMNAMCSGERRARSRQIFRRQLIIDDMDMTIRAILTGSDWRSRSRTTWRRNSRAGH